MMATLEDGKIPAEDTKSLLGPAASSINEAQPDGDNTSNFDPQNQTDSSKTLSYLWTALEGGSYNRVWKSNFTSPQSLVDNDSYAGPWILKYPIVSANAVSNAMNDPNRAVRLWNEINADLPRAGLYKLGWVAPLISNARQATDEEIAHKLIEIYIEQRRIVVDAATEGNFLTCIDTNKTILVDVDLALKRSTSFASIEYAKNLEGRFSTYWLNLSLKHRPITLEVTRNLLYLEDQLLQSIDTLCQQKLITLQNVLSLTWLRKNNRDLSLDLYKKIAVLNEAASFTENLLEALVTAETKPKRKSSEIVKNSKRLSFFRGGIPEGDEKDLSSAPLERNEVVKRR